MASLCIRGSHTFYFCPISKPLSKTGVCQLLKTNENCCYPVNIKFTAGGNCRPCKPIVLLFADKIFSIKRGVFVWRRLQQCGKVSQKIQRLQRSHFCTVVMPIHGGKLPLRQVLHNYFLFHAGISAARYPSSAEHPLIPALSPLAHQ
jgi:hypothetical protein